MQKRIDKAVVVPLAGTTIPDKLLESFDPVHLPVDQGDWQSLENSAKGGQLNFVWTGGNWDLGFECVSQMDDEVRQTTVLIGERGQGHGLVASAIEHGILATVAVPLEPWFVKPLMDAAIRAPRANHRRLGTAIEEIRRDIEQIPESLLIRAAEAAGHLLGSDLAVATLKTAESESFEVLARSEEGQVHSETWESDATRQQAPSGLAEFIKKKGEIAVVPSAAHSNVCRVGLGPEAFDSAVICPIIVENQGLADPSMSPLVSSPDEGGPFPLMASLNLYWREPHLPTPNEILALKVLAAFATSALARLVDQQRLANMGSRARRIIVDQMGKVAEGVFQGQADRAFERPEVTVPKFIELMGEAYAGRPSLRELWIRFPVPFAGRRRSQWMSFGESSEEEEAPPDRAIETSSDLRITEVVDGNGGWAVQGHIVPLKPHLGELVAIFTSRASATAARAEITRLIEELYTASRQHRQAADRAAQLHLSTLPAGAEAAGDELQELLETIREHTGSDGAKVTTMLRTPDGPIVKQLGNTSLGAEKAMPAPYFAEERGLADWVLSNQQWLLVPKMRDGGEGPEDCLTQGKRGQVEKVHVVARPEKEFLEDADDADQEETMLFVPLFTGGRATGALSIWRDKKDSGAHVAAYDEVGDVESLQGFGPYVAATCQRMVHRGKAQDELEAISKLALHLGSADCLSKAYDAVVADVGGLADAAIAILLHYDSAVAELYQSASWCADADMCSLVDDRLRRFHVSVGHESSTWTDAVKEGLGGRLQGYHFRSLLIPRTSGKQPPTLAVALFDKTVGLTEPVFVPDELLEHFSRSFLSTAGAMLDGYAATLASRLIDQIGGSQDWTDISAQKVLEHALRLVRKATGADATIVYTGTPQSMHVRSVYPPIEGHKVLAVKPGSTTEQALKNMEPVRKLDVGHHGSAMSQEGLEELLHLLEWPGFGSWLACPLVHGGRSIGLIKLLTRSKGGFLGEDHELMIRMIAGRTAVEMYKANLREQQSLLLGMSDRLTQFSGRKLGDEIVHELQLWLKEGLMRPQCEVVVVTRVPQGNTSLVIAKSSGVGKALFSRLQETSKQWRKTSKQGMPDDDVERDRQLHSPRGVAVTVELPGEERLGGHLFLLDEEIFYRDEIEAIANAAHHVALVINSERERNNWRQVMGRFRHALIGPAQGLTSAGKSLASLAAKAAKGDATVLPERIEKLRLRILTESEIIRLWRDNQRFYLSSDPDIQRKRVALRPIVDRCVNRYVPLAKQRGIGIDVDWPLPGGELQVFLDPDALDIALSNLLENACKYSYKNREIVVGVDKQQSYLTLWVEDVGHPVPDQVKEGESIYQLGRRDVKFDPFRVITGQGIGLTMVAAIANAHDGVLKHKSREEGKGRTDETQPFRVRFTIELPWSA